MPKQTIQLTQEGVPPRIYRFPTIPLVKLSRSTDYMVQPLQWCSEPLVIYAKTLPLVVDLEWEIAALDEQIPANDFPRNPSEIIYGTSPFDNGINFLHSLVLPDTTIGTGVQQFIPPKTCRFLMNPFWLDLRCIVRKVSFEPSEPYDTRAIGEEGYLQSAPYAGRAFMTLQETYLLSGDTIPDAYSESFDKWLAAMSGQAGSYRTYSDIRNHFYKTFP